MKQEDKDLLLRDLCGRLPYGVKVKTSFNKIDEPIELKSININNCTFAVGGEYITISGIYFDTYTCKPYLFPLSSMTEEQREELYKIGWYLDEDKIYSCFRNYDDVNYKTHIDCFELINWCYKNNFDINGLIPMGLAIDATDKNIY